MKSSLPLDRICAGSDLSRAESAAIFDRLMAGELSEIEISALLMALKAKGETPDEIAGAAEALRRAAKPFPRPDYGFADTCGTGGDGAHTVNISTAAAFVAAEAGVPIVKHGNRSVSSKCGSADVLEACGVTLSVSAEVARRCLDEAGVCFLFAPAWHAGVRHAMPVRRALGVRTIFNLLGPLVNPAAPTWQVMGVYDPALCAPLAKTLGMLGCTSALVVHGSGHDELAVHGPTTAAHWHHGALTMLNITPASAGIESHPAEALAGGDPAENGAWLRALLGGHGVAAHVDAVAINAGALVWISGRAPDLRRGVAAAKAAIASGGPLRRLERLAELSGA